MSCGTHDTFMTAPFTIKITNLHRNYVYDLFYPSEHKIIIPKNNTILMTIQFTDFNFNLDRGNIGVILLVYKNTTLDCLLLEIKNVEG
jgi:hypothetical protein